MPDIALYYPWTRVRDDAWLKAAALYLPRLAVMAPSDYRRSESLTAQILRDELGFLVDADPAPRAGHLAEDFLTLISNQAPALVARYGWLTDFPRELNDVLTRHCAVAQPVDDDRVNWVHRGKLPPPLVQRLVETRLGMPSADEMSIALHPRLGAVYLMALADRVARANNLVPITDQPAHYGALNGWTLQTLTLLLLSDESDRQSAVSADQVSAMYGSVAVGTVVPAGLGTIPAAQIVRVRRALAAEFDAFRAHLDTMTDQFTDLALSEDSAILRARLDDLVEKDLRRPTAELERGLRRLGLEPVRAVLGLTSLALPAAVEWLPETAGAPVAVGAGGLVAATLIGAGARAREQARDRRRTAAGYLLGIRQELNPTGVVERVRRVFRRTTERSRPSAHRS